LPTLTLLLAELRWLQIAEVARLAPRQLIGETTAGSTILIFLGYIAGPSAFAALVTATGRFDVAFVGVALATLAALLGLRTPLYRASVNGAARAR
jgi:hypothetical protein